MCAGAHIHGYVCMHAHMYVKPRVQPWSTPQVLSTLFFVTGFLTWPETCPIFKAGQPESLRNPLINLHIAGITRVCHHPWSVCGGVCDSRDLTQIFFTLVELCYLSLVKTPISWKKKGLDMVSHSCNPVLTVGWGAQSRRILSSRLN